jgi:hypothetical protein
MLVFIQELRRFFLAVIEEVVRIFGVVWPNINTVVNVSGMSYLMSLHNIYVYHGTKKAIFDGSKLRARGPPVKKKKNSFPRFGKRFFKRKMISQGSGNEFSNEK